VADSTREYVKIRDVSGIVRFLTVNLGPPIVAVLTLGAPVPAASFVEKPYPAILDFVTLLDTNSVPWHARVNAGGTLESVQGNVNGVTMAGYGVFGLTLRGATWNTFTLVVSVAGVLSFTNTAAPANDIINPDYVDGTSRVAFCRHHNLAYRPDERITYRAATHCPVDGARLVGWRELVRGRQYGDDAASNDAYENERW